MTQTLRRSDSEIKSAVVDELEWTPSVDSTHVGVAVDEGAVTLSGEVGSYLEKLMATKATQRVHGVTAIAQEITVRTPWSEINDSDIAREAGEALERAIDVPDSVKAVVHDHVVTLTGTVAWHYQRSAADRAVRYAKGVTSLLNLVKILPVSMVSEVKSSITSALVRNARVETRNIRVTTEAGGVVTLHGTARSWSERGEAEQACWAAPGVTEVVNDLRIEY